jgi:isoamylase
MLLEGSAQVTGIRRRGQDATRLRVFTAHHEDVPVTLPPSDDNRWALVVDTARPEAEAETPMQENAHTAKARSFQVFLRDAQAG